MQPTDGLQVCVATVCVNLHNIDVDIANRSLCHACMHHKVHDHMGLCMKLRVNLQCYVKIELWKR